MFGRCSTPFGITDHIGRRSDLSVSTPISCAQRLSASRIISGAADRTDDRSGRNVLNAFRHHGSYRFVIGDVRRTYPDSAQRLSASRIISASQTGGNPVTSPKCSTPFGITDHIGRDAANLYSTKDAECSTPFGITDHIGSAAANDDIVPIRCSTPFGITDHIGTWSRSPTASSLRSAQRLSASRIIYHIGATCMYNSTRGGFECSCM